jgi:hypothetical protein
MTTQEIKECLKVDIKQKNRTEMYIYIRSIYINQEHNKGKKLREIADSLDLRSHAAIVNILKKTDTYKLDPFFMLIEKAYKTKDFKYIEEFKKFSNLRREEQVKFRGERNYAKVKALQVPKEEHVLFTYKKPKKIIRPHILEVAEKLRFKNTALNNLPYPEWTEKDFNNYYKIISNVKTN